MKKKIQIIYFLIFLMISNISNSEIEPKFDNISISKNPIEYKDITLTDFNGKLLNLKKTNHKLYILNFWATWCAPCKEEMPHLDELQKLIGIEVFPINIEKINKQKVEIFFKSLEIKNLQIFFDNQNNLVNMFSLRGIPTTIILNKEKKEIARIIGFADFSDQVFIDWLNSMKELK